MTKRLRGSLRNQRRVEKEYRKKYHKQAMESRDGSVTPPTIWNYRKALVFSAPASQDRGGEAVLSSGIGPGSYRTNAARSSDDNH